MISEIVRTGTIDGTIISGDTERYELDAKPKEERLFVARLPVGTYRIKTFRHEGFSAMGGELGISFTVAPKVTQYDRATGSRRATASNPRKSLYLPD